MSSTVFAALLDEKIRSFIASYNETSQRWMGNGRTIWITDAHREGKRFVVRADEALTAYRYFLLANRNSTARICV